RTRARTGTPPAVRRDDALCTSSQSAALLNPPAVSLSPAKTDLPCTGVPTGAITATFSGGTGALQLQIDGGGFNPFASPHTFTGLAAGSHTVQLRDVNLCSTSQSVTLSQPAAVALTLSKNDGCPGQSNGTITATFSGGSGTLQLSLDGGAFTTFTSPHTFGWVAPGSDTVTARDANLCRT